MAPRPRRTERWWIDPDRPRRSPGAWPLPRPPCRSRRACQTIKTLAAQIRVIRAQRVGSDKAIACKWGR
jgi:hypothetical protein